ncbi:MAG: T9SS type A sorting domain-containing protein [Candidatus Cloacimonetes bacterium]|nr:T9SS type A sorting domain-containing protein [Candidatus Cloacimonadota bacterium]
MLKKTIIVALFVLIVIAYAQNIFWGDGLNVLKGNYIYYYESVKTDDNSVIVCWSEADNINRKIKMQKILSNGDFAWEEPRTVIDENSPVMCEKLLKSSDEDLFTFISNDCNQYEKICKFDQEGNVIWCEELGFEDNSIFKDAIPDNNGGIYIFYEQENSDFVKINAIHVLSNDNETEQEIIELYSVNNEIYYIFHKAFIIDDKIILFYEENDNHLTNYYDFSGNQIWETPISLGTINDYRPKYKFINDKIYALWQDVDIFFQAIDVNGELLYQDETLLFENVYNYDREMLINEENIILLFHDTDSSEIHYYNLYLDGTIINQETYDLPISNYSHIKVIDEQTDFILGVIDAPNDQYQYVIFPITESCIDTTPILLDDVLINHRYNMPITYFINENFIMFSSPMSNNDFTVNINDQDGNNPEQKLIRETNNEFRSPKISKHNEDIVLNWIEYRSREKLFGNIIDSEGNFTYDMNGIEIYDITDKYRYEQEIIGDKSVVVSSQYVESDQHNAYYQEFDLAGNPITDEISFLQNEHIGDVGTLPCDVDSYYIYATYITENWWSDGTLIQKITDGNFEWEDPIVIESEILNIINNTIFFSSYNYPYSELYYANFDDSGYLGDIIELENSVYHYSMQAFKHNEKTIISWRDSSDNTKIHYIDDNDDLIWSYPLSIDLVDEILVEEDKISTVKFTENNTAQFCAYDYEKNILDDYQFEIDWDSDIVGYSIKKVDNIFVIIATFRYGWQNNEIKYSVIDETGSILLYFGEDTFCDIIFPNHIDQVLQDDKILYVLFSNIHETYNYLNERDYFIQKMDFSDYTVSDNSNLNKPVLTTIAYPNPFNPTVNISYNLPNDSKISLEIFNIKGQKIKTILAENQKAGNHQTIWKGNDENEKRVSSGIYFYKLKTDKQENIKKIILMK